ncbi:MAG: hypothetical protein ACAI35_27510, partial [Candidatus Methylacidiphilales bacterium]
INSEAQITLPNGTVVTLRQTGTVPWGEQVQLEVVAIQHPGQTAPDPVNRAAFTLTFRVPGWASLGMTLETRNCEVDTSIWPNYLLEHSVSGTWRAGSVVELTLPMPIRRLVCNPLVTNNNGCVALQRGPFIYCVEDADYEQFTVLQLALAHTADISARHDPQLLGGVTLLEAPQGSAVMSAFPIYNPDSVQELPCRDGDDLFPQFGFKGGNSPLTSEPLYVERNVDEWRVPFRAVPYFAWANRNPGAMKVWIPLR